MRINYNVTGARRKELVRIIADTTGAKAEYMKMPTSLVLGRSPCYKLREAISICESNGLIFDGIAEKVNADVYIDDRAVRPTEFI